MAYDDAMTQTRISTTSIYRRLAQIGFSVALLVFVLTMWVSTHSRGERIQQDNTSALTRSLAHQASLTALRLIKAKNSKALPPLLDDLAQDPNIHSAMIYDRQGKVLAQSSQATAALEQYNIQNQSTEPDAPIRHEQQTKTYVADIIDGDVRIGFLRVHYLQGQAIKAPLRFHHGLMRQVLLMMLCCGVIGFLLTRGFARFSRGSMRLVEDGEQREE